MESVINRLLLLVLLSVSNVFSIDTVKQKKVKYLVPSMVCMNCQNSITKSLKKIKRIKEINFDIPKKNFVLTFDENQPELSKEELKAIYEATTYSIIAPKKKSKSKKNISIQEKS